MRVFIDADACPVVSIVENISKKYNIPVTLLCDTNHVLTSEYSEVIVVGAGADAVDQHLSQGRYCGFTGLWSGSDGVGKRCVCHSSVWQMVHQ